MSTPRKTVTLVGILLAAGLPCRSLADETPASDEDQEALRITKELVEKAADDVKVFPDLSAESPLTPEIVLRWKNPVRIRTGAGVLAVWPHKGRPEAMASIYVWDDDMCHEFGSLSRGDQLTVRHRTGARWSVQSPGVEFKAVPDAPPPAETPAARLRQMKAIAERFSARLTDQTSNNENREVLRLLAKPVYRYEIKDASGDSLQLLDGTLFAYVMGTDPEVILRLEAVGPEAKAAWQYAFAVATTHAVEARLSDEVVWSHRGFGGGRSERFLRRKLAE